MEVHGGAYSRAKQSAKHTNGACSTAKLDHRLACAKTVQPGGSRTGDSHRSAQKPRLCAQTRRLRVQTSPLLGWYAAAKVRAEQHGACGRMLETRKSRPFQQISACSRGCVVIPKEIGCSRLSIEAHAELVPVNNMLPRARPGCSTTVRLTQSRPSAVRQWTC